MSTGLISSSFNVSGSQKVVALLPPDYAAADEGSLFVATNTPGTVIATTTSVVDDNTGATTHAQQKPVMVIGNQWTAGNTNSQTIYLRYLKMFISQVPTTATNWKYAMRLSPNLGTKITAAGTVITPQILNPANTVASKALIQFGTITTTDSTTDTGQRLIANGQVAAAIPVAADEWLFTFGAVTQNFDASITSANVKRTTIPTVPVFITPGWIWTLEMWGASNAAAPSWEFELMYIERPSGQ